MIDERERFERAFGLFDMPEPAFERLASKRARMLRRRRVRAAVVALGIAIGAGVLLSRAWTPSTRQPAHTPTPTTVPLSWARFDSPSYGYSISLPPNWTVTSAARLWKWDEPRRSDLVSAEVPVTGGSHTFNITIASAAIPDDLTDDGWNAYEDDVHRELDTSCARPPSVEPTDVDGFAASLAIDCGDHVIVTFRAADRAYVIATLLTVIPQDLDLILQVIGTMEVRPVRAAPAPDGPTVWRGIWPQSTRAAAVEAQARADADGSESVGQVDWNQDGRLAKRFVVEQLGWSALKEVGVSYVPSDSEQSWEAEVVEWYFIRCEDGGTNPLYPDDPAGRNCAPTIDETHYQQIVVRAEQLIRQGRSGIWLITGWDEVQPYEQSVPPSQADLANARRVIARFMEARIAGSGAGRFLLDDSITSRLYRTADGKRYTTFQISTQPSSLIEPGWPFGGFDTYIVRMFADARAGCQVERIHVNHADEDDPAAGVVLSRGYAWSGDEQGGYRAESGFCNDPIDTLDARLW